MSVLTLVLTSGGVQRGLIVKKPSKNTSVDILNLDEGSIPFTRSTLLLSKFAIFQATVIRVSYEAARISPVSLGFHSRNRNRGSGADDSTDGLALSLIHCRKKHGAPRLDRSRGEVATAEIFGPRWEGRFRDSLATPWLWPPSEPWCLRRALAHGPVLLDGLE